MLELRILGIQENAKKLYDLAMIVGPNGDGGCEEDSKDLYNMVDEIVALDIPEMLEEILALQKELDDIEIALSGQSFEREIASDD